MAEVARLEPLRVSETVHVVESSRRCYAAIVTEVVRTGARVHFFLPPGARVPWPGVPHPYDPAGHEVGSIHRIHECT